MKQILFFLLFLKLISCSERKDIIIQNSTQNCSCNEPIKEAYRDEIEKYRNKFGTVSFGEVNCDNPFYPEEEENYKSYLKTNTLEVFNKSETLVYEVIIQINKSGKITYEKIRLEPTQSSLLGCNMDFELNYKPKKIDENPSINNFKISNFKKIEYKIHKTNIISEY